jgi:iron-sulfur cluster assembly protein
MAPNRRNVVALSEAAAAKVKELQRENAKKYLRVAVKQGGKTGFMYDLQLEDAMDPDKDWVGESRGVLIVVDKSSAHLVEGSTINWVETKEKRGFEFDNPLAVKQKDA